MSSEIFKPASKTIRKILSDSDSFYEIPDYQRPYQWEPEQVEQLWDDLYSSYEASLRKPETPDAYFLGSIILIKSGDHFDVVDGQQRLTTLTILLCVVRDLCPDLDKKTQNIISQSISDKIEDKPRLRFRTSIEHQNEYEQTVLNGVQFPTKVGRQKRLSAYLTTAITFRDKLEQLETEQVEGFLRYILESVQMISITCENQSIAIKLFQVLNARGVDLNASDLIKSFLMDSLENKQRIQFMATWKQISLLGESMNEKMDSLLNYYLYFLKGNNPEAGLYEELVRLLRGREPNEVAYELKSFVVALKESTSMTNRYVYTLRYLRHEVYWKTALATAQFKNRDDVEEVSKVLRDFYYAHWIAGYTSNKIKQASFRLIQLIKENASLQAITDETNAVMEKHGVGTRIKVALAGNAYDERWLKPLLLAIEYAQTDSVPEFIHLNQRLHAEHILPVAHEKSPYWSKLFNREEGRKYVNSVANLTLLSGKKNISASNLAFADKIKKYEGKGEEGLTAFRITQRVRDRFVEVSRDWGIPELEERFKWILNEISSELGIETSKLSFGSIGSEDEYINEEASGEDVERESEAPQSFHSGCATIFNRVKNRSFVKKSTSVYEDAAGSTAFFKVSKQYDSGNYWFAVNRENRRVLDSNPRENLVVFGCGSAETLISFTGNELIPLLDEMLVTDNSESFHWHIYIERTADKFFFKLRGGGRIEITDHLLPSETTGAA